MKTSADKCIIGWRQNKIEFLKFMVHYTVNEISYFVKHNNQGEYHEKENFSQNIAFRGSHDMINRMWRK